MNTYNDQFLHRSGLTYLNHGSFGATPRAILEEYTRWQYEMEADLVHFMVDKGINRLEESRTALGKYINCSADDLVFITNPSYGVNMVSRSLGLKQDDEVLTTDLEYGACDKAWMYYCEQVGAKYIRQPIPLPIENKDQFIAQFFAGLTSMTKIIFISHITSSTALIFPVKEIVDHANELGLITIVDGAHVPGQLDLDITALNADIYIGACHKWMCTPKGCSFIYVKKDLQARIDPLVISWGYKSLSPSHSQFLDYHQMNGTRDFSAFLTIPFVIEWLKEHEWEKKRMECRDLILESAPWICDVLETKPLAPLTLEWIPQMFSVEISSPAPETLYQTLLDRFLIQIPVMRHDDKVYLRYSINVYNDRDDIDKLAKALILIKETTDLLG